MMRQTWRGWVAAGCLTLGLLGCTKKPEVKMLERGKVDAPHRVLIATESTEFKAQVVSTLLGQLVTADTYVKVIDLGKVASEPAAGYDVIVLLAHRKAWMLSADAKNVIESTPDKGKLILLATHKVKAYTRDDVDTVSSASKVEDAAAIAGEIAKRIQAILGR